ncbi:M14 family metallopeptidase [Alteribacillus iranensis]|nr:M14 family metallopeptidase [Alteribacillus iranensis]
MRKYVIQPGDTLSKIAYRNNVRIDDIVRNNHHLPSKDSYLSIGDFLSIPEPHTTKQIHSKENHIACHNEYGWRELEDDRERLGVSIYQKKIGWSRLGKPIWLFRVGKGKKRICYSGTWHGNEWLNTWLLMKFLMEIERKYRNHESWHHVNIRAVLDEEVTLYFLPLVNPDGAELVQEGLQRTHSFFDEIHTINEGFHCYKHWSANAAGVDLNHQWPAGWKRESDTSPQRPFPRHYGGEAPLTEPETRAVYQLTMEEEFDIVLAFHSQGEEIYWGYQHLEPPESRAMAEKLAKASSFRAVQTADSSAGYKDWFIKEFRRPGFTIETGVGQNPLSITSAARIWITTVPLLLETLTWG